MLWCLYSSLVHRCIRRKYQNMLFYFLLLNLFVRGSDGPVSLNPQAYNIGTLIIQTVQCLYPDSMMEKTKTTCSWGTFQCTILNYFKMTQPCRSISLYPGSIEGVEIKLKIICNSFALFRLAWNFLICYIVLPRSVTQLPINFAIF